MGFTFRKSYGNWIDFKFVELGQEHVAACRSLVESQLRSPDNTIEASLAYPPNVIDVRLQSKKEPPLQLQVWQNLSKKSFQS